MRLWQASALAAACTILLACGGGGGGGAQKNPPSASGPLAYYKVGGNVVGLRGSGLVLRIGTGETIAIEADGAFSFPTPIGNLLGYQVSVLSQPSQLTQVCTVSNATGVISGAEITNIVVSCATSSFPVHANVSGLEGSGLRIRLQVTDDSSLPPQTVDVVEDGEIAFPTALLDGTHFELSIAQQPSSQWCIVDHELPLQHSPNSAPWSIECTSDTYRVGGTVFGLRGTGLELTNNGTDVLAISDNGTFAFSAPLFDHTSYEVKVRTQPTNLRQRCFVTNASGSVEGSEVGNVFVNCTATQQLGSTGDDEARAVGIDAARNLYVAGRTNASVEAANAGGWDGFVLKLNPDGDVQWWRQLGSAGDESVNSIAVTTSGDIYIAGSTSGDLEGSNAGSNDMFVASYNAAGDRQWIRQLGTSASDVAHGVAFGPDGGIYVAGATEGELVTANAAGGPDAFILKLDANGAEQWKGQLGSSQSDVAYGIDVDATGAAYIAGGTEGDFDGNANPSGGEIGFVSRFASDGTKQGTSVYCSFLCSIDQRQSRFNSIALSGSGEVYVAGWTRAIEGGGSMLGGKKALKARFSGGAFLPVKWSDAAGEQEITGIVIGNLDAELYSVGNVRYDSPLDSIGTVARAPLLTLVDEYFPVVSSHNLNIEMHAISSDAVDNTYAVGFTNGSVDDQPNLGGSDIVIVRYNAAGEKL